MSKWSKGGWLLEWKHGVKGTNLAATSEQKSTWFLWGYNPRGGQSILATVRKEGSMYVLRNSMRGGVKVSNHRMVSAAKTAAEKLVGARSWKPTGRR